MASLSFKQLSLQLRPNESVLDCLLRHAQPIPYSCRAGACQACLVKAVTPPPSVAQEGLKPALRDAGYALACQWYPAGNVAVAPIEPGDLSVTASILELTKLNPYVMKVLLLPQDPLALSGIRPGQYLTLTNPPGVVRSYSVANDYAQDRVLELHVASTQQGLFSRWVFDNAQVGDLVYLRGPAGDCYYDPRHVEADATPLLLVGTGSGLAPLYGIARDALARGHQAPIRLFHGGHDAEHLYYIDALRELASTHANFHYYPCVRAQDGDSRSFFIGALEAVIKAQCPASELPRLHAFVAGAPAFVQQLRKQLFLQGVRPAHIHADPFTEREVQTS